MIQHIRQRKNTFVEQLISLLSAMKQISKTFLFLTFTLSLVSSSDLREYSQPIIIYKRQTKSTQANQLSQISFSYAEETQCLYIYDQQSSNSHIFSLKVLTKQEKTYIQINQTLLTKASDPIKRWSVSRNGNRILWITNDGSIFMKGEQDYLITFSDVSLLSNNTLNFIFSSDGNRVVLKYQEKHSYEHIQSVILSLQNHNIEPIQFINSKEAIVIGMMNKDNVFIVIQQQPLSSNDDRNYVIKEIQFNYAMNFYLQDTAKTSLVGKFDNENNDIALRVGQDDGFMVFYSGNQAVLLRREKDKWITKDRKLFSQYRAGILSSQNGLYLLIKSQNKNPILYGVNKDFDKFQKLAIIDTPIEPITNYYVTNDGNIFISNGEDLYFLKQILPYNSSGSSINASSFNKIIDIKPFSSFQNYNGLQILRIIILLCIILFIILVMQPFFAYCVGTSNIRRSRGKVSEIEQINNN